MSTPEPVAAVLAAGQVAPVGAELVLWSRAAGRRVVPLLAADGDADESRAWRHEATLRIPGDVPEDWVERGTRVRLRASMVGSDGRTHWAPLVAGAITRRFRPVSRAAWSVTVRSPEWSVVRADFVRPVTVSGSAVSQLRRLVGEAAPGVPIEVDARVADVHAPERVYEPGSGSRMTAVTELARTVGGAFFATPAGGFRLAPLGSYRDGGPDWTVRQGFSLTDAGVEDDDEWYANVVVVENRDGDSEDVRAVAFAQPGQPGYVGDVAFEALTGAAAATGDERGRGMFVRTLSLPVPHAQAAMWAARAFLDGMPQEVRRITFDAIDNPWITAGSRLHLVMDGRTSRHVVTRRPWSIPSAPTAFEIRR